MTTTIETNTGAGTDSIESTATELVVPVLNTCSRSGYAPVKAEYHIQVSQPVESESRDSNSDKANAKRGGGMNKKRQFKKISSKADVCFSVAVNKMCSLGENCKHSHDLVAYMKERLADPLDFSDEPCPVFKQLGQCPFGVRCHFFRAHTDEGGKQIVAEAATLPVQVNVLSRDVLIALRKKVHKFPRAEEQYRELQKYLESTADAASRGEKSEVAVVDASVEQPASIDVNGAIEESQPVASVEEEQLAVGAVIIDTKSEAKIKKSIDWRGKSYLAPLTTVGNLPFRRLCKKLGVDVTCGEMAMADCLLQGNASEWALTRRHPSEDVFGVQICGKAADMVMRAVDVLNENCELDFIDLNCGCPIDLVYNAGSGSALMRRSRKFEAVVRGMSMTSTVPITVKIRTGIESNKNVAHQYIPKLKEWGASLVTLHGRSRQQRYTKLADWEYIGECGKIARSLDLPLFGNGDIMSYEEYHVNLEKYSVDGAMVGRAALIKPWIFTEFKERRHWDISSTERFDLMRTFCNHGLEHWGSDAQGLNKTRRFLMEWQSFHCRYIPTGLLEVLPQKMNDRPPRFHGRDDLETLLASDNANDWLKLSEMLLGKAPEDFVFVPKHKSNSYESG